MRGNTTLEFDQEDMVRVSFRPKRPAGPPPATVLPTTIPSILPGPLSTALPVATLASSYPAQSEASSTGLPASVKKLAPPLPPKERFVICEPPVLFCSSCRHHYFLTIIVHPRTHASIICPCCAGSVASAVRLEHGDEVKFSRPSGIHSCVHNHLVYTAVCIIIWYTLLCA
jgi:hypothetical protein